MKRVGSVIFVLAFAATAAFAQTPGAAPISLFASLNLAGDAGACATAPDGAGLAEAPIFLANCSATASCGSGTVSCTGTSSCTTADRTCPTEQGHVTCNGVTTWCPTACCGGTDWCCQCSATSACFACCRCSGGSQHYCVDYCDS